MKATQPHPHHTTRTSLAWIDSFLANDQRHGQEYGLAFRGKELVAMNPAREIRPATVNRS